MPLFSYRATDGMGSTQQGSIDAVSADAARSALNDKGWTPIDVTEVSTNPFSFVSPETPKAIPSKPQTVAPVQEQVPAAPVAKVYLPIASTLRLYAGWLLAYYAVVYALGWYAQSRPLPFEIPYVGALLVSPLVLSFTFAAFLFLLFHSLYRMLGGGMMKGVAVGVLGVAVFAVYRMNVV